MLLTGLAWSIATTYSPAGIVRLTLIYVFIHFLAGSLLVATAAYFFVGRLLGPGIAGLPGRRRQQGLFVQAEDREQLEFGYCFDVSSEDYGFGDVDIMLTSTIGSYTRFLPSMGTALCSAVHPLALDIDETLVRCIATRPFVVLANERQDIIVLRQYTLSCCIWVLLCDFFPWV